MHPWRHAESSAALHGGTVEEFLPFHDHFDATKTWVAHISHRMFRHHQEGIELARQHFGEVVSSRAVSTRTLGEQHLAEDTSGGFLPRAHDWLKHITPAGRIPDLDALRIPSAEELAETCRRRHGGALENWLPLQQWFHAPSAWHDTPRWLAIRHHAGALFEAEARFGHVLRLQDGTLFPVRAAGEAHIRLVLGRIPAAVDWCRCLKPQPWMSP